MERLIAYKGEEPYLFISYAHKNFDEVHEIISELSRLGLHIWYDEGIDPGNEWPEEIAKAIDNAALFVVFVTIDAMASKNVISECYYALDNNKPFLSVFIEDVPFSPGLALRASSTQAIMKFRMSDNDFYKKMIQTIEFKLPNVLVEDVLKLNQNTGGSKNTLKKTRKSFKKEILIGIVILAFFLFVGFTANAIGNINQMIGQIKDSSAAEPENEITTTLIETTSALINETTVDPVQVVTEETVGLTMIDDVPYFNDQRVITSKKGLYITFYDENMYMLWVNRLEVADDLKNFAFASVAAYDDSPSLRDFQLWSKNDDGVHYYEDRYGYGFGNNEAPHCVVFLYDSNKVLLGIVEFRNFRD